VVPSGRRARRREATRAVLLEAGRALLAERGLYEARIEDVALRAGVAKGSVYLHFRSKDHLVREVVAWCFDELGDAVERHAGEARTLAEVSRRVAEAHLEAFAAAPGSMRILHQARGMLLFERPEWRALRAPLDRHLDRVARVIARASGIDPAPARARAVALFGAVSGWASVLGATGADRAPGAWRRQAIEAATTLMPGRTAGRTARIPARRARRGA
jgi:AcrR family transcriptional regulator